MPIPLSATFIDFLARWVEKSWKTNENWPDQWSETLSNQVFVSSRRADARLNRLLLLPEAQAPISRAREWFDILASGRDPRLEAFHARYRFLCVVGLPRSAGSYLTAEAYYALGHDPHVVPAAIAHDGFPVAQPGVLERNGNMWLATLQSVAEYFTLVELFFNDRSSAVQTVPKKIHKAIYAGSLFNRALGKDSEYIVTIRHPIAACVSTYEKSGGFPADGLFKARTAIERWIKRDLVSTGMKTRDVDSLPYFEAFVRYWEQYYIRLAVSGLLAHRRFSIVPFSALSVTVAARSLHEQLGNGTRPQPFVSHEGLIERHPSWVGRSQTAAARVAAAWDAGGLAFPQEISLCV